MNHTLAKYSRLRLRYADKEKCSQCFACVMLLGSPFCLGAAAASLRNCMVRCPLFRALRRKASKTDKKIDTDMDFGVAHGCSTEAKTRGVGVALKITSWLLVAITGVAKQANYLRLVI